MALSAVSGPTQPGVVEESREPSDHEETPQTPDELENERVRSITRQIDEEIRATSRAQIREEEDRKRDYLLRSKGPIDDSNPVRVSRLRDVGTGDTVQQMDVMDVEGRRVLQSTSSVVQRSPDVEERKSPTASPHTTEV